MTWDQAYPVLRVGITGGLYQWECVYQGVDILRVGIPQGLWEGNVLTGVSFCPWAKVGIPGTRSLSGVECLV